MGLSHSRYPFKFKIFFKFLFLNTPALLFYVSLKAIL